jgi:hypothetical protein
MCEILMLIFGIITLSRGRFLSTRVKEVRGWPARIIGALLVIPFPLSFLLGMVLGGVFLAMGKDIEGQEFKSMAQILELGIVALCFIAAIGVAMFYAEPIRKKQSEHIDAVIPDNYEERFQASGREDSDSPNITGGSSRPSSPPDDRIQS